MSRTYHVKKNIKYAVMGQMLGICISFFSRMVFIRMLGAQYLGLNGLFTNILSMLSLAEMGIGSAITYTMYQPLAKKNETKIQTLMKLYQKAYRAIGTIVGVGGICLTPFISFFIKEMPEIEGISIIYMLFVINTALSYFFSYKRALIIADQKRYIATFYRYSFYVGLNILQIVMLYITQNYVFYLMLQVGNTFLENIFISKKANQLYPYLKNKEAMRLEKEEKDAIVKNVKAMMCHKIGTTMVMGTDNLLISKFVGLLEVGMYSNYLLIKNALNMMFGLLFQSLTASIGNLAATEGTQKKQFVFECIELIGFWIYGFSSICLLILFNPFITLWVGKVYLFPMGIVTLIIINFYLTGMRKSVLTFRDALGLFWYDRYKPIFEAGINLILSIVFVKYLGIAGIFLGTTMSTLLACFWVEPFVLYKYGFKSSVKPYFIRYLKYATYLVGIGSLTTGVSSLLPEQGVIPFICKGIVCLILPNLCFMLVFCKNPAFKHVLKILTKNIGRKEEVPQSIQGVNEGVCMNQIVEKFIEKYGKEPEGAVSSPLRICPLGAHIDHQGGIVTGMALNASVNMVYTDATDGFIRVQSLDFPDEEYFHIDYVPEMIPGFWGNYIRGAVLALKQHHLLKKGFHAIVSGKLPIGGLSSSAAVTTAYLMALCDVNGIETSKIQLMNDSHWVETHYIGLKNGILDQAANILSQKNHLMVMDCLSQGHYLVPKSEKMADFEVVIVYSGVTKALIGTDYNNRVDECKVAGWILQELEQKKRNPLQDVKLRDISQETYDEYKGCIPGRFQKRAHHFFTELERVKQGEEAWEKGDLEHFGKLMFESGESSMNQYECGCPELITLFEILKRCKGVYGARFSGAGYRGCCIGLIDPKYKESIQMQIDQQYPQEHPMYKDTYKVHFCQVADGARIMKHVGHKNPIQQGLEQQELQQRVVQEELENKVRENECSRKGEIA